MSAHPVTYYQAKCDRCGYIETDYGEFSAMADRSDVITLAYESGWESIGDLDLCPDCYFINDDDEVEMKEVKK